MKSIRNSNIFGSNKRLAERKTIVGAFQGFDRDIYREKFFYPHEEMSMCVEMYNRNSYVQSAVNTMKDFIKGGDIVVKSNDEASRIQAQGEMDRLNVDSWIDEVIENTIKTGNGYLEVDFADAEWKKPQTCYPIADSSRIYINCDEFGLPKKEKVSVTNPVTKQPEILERRNDEEFFVQRIDAGFRHPKAKWYDMSYHVGFQFKKFRIYGIPINKKKIIHFKLNIGDTGIYARSYLAATLDDWESLKQIERSIAVIAKYKAVPRDIIMYGDKDNPATDDELDEFIVYLESLEKDESAVINKPIKRESLSYAGQDINLDYMIQHITKKLVAGIAPDFMMGVGESLSKATAQISLISYILAIYSKRKLFLKPIEQQFLRPFCQKNGLQKCWLEFGELDFETKSEKVNRIGALWTQNLLTFNEARKSLSLTSIGDVGDVYYLEWQSSMMDSGMGFPELPGAPGDREDAGALPNNEDPSKVFSHNEPADKKPVMKDGQMPFDPNANPTDTPKFLRRNDGVLSGAEVLLNPRLLANRQTITRNNASRLYDVPMPEGYNLETNTDYGNHVVKHEANEGENEEEGILPYEWDLDPNDPHGRRMKRVWIGNSLEKMQEATLTIEIPDEDMKNLKVKKISFDTLMHQFGAMFEEPRLTEICYKEIEGGWRVSFVKDTVLIFCHVLATDIVEYYTSNEDRILSEEDQAGLIIGWKNQFLVNAIQEE